MSEAKDLSLNLIRPPTFFKPGFFLFFVISLVFFSSPKTKAAAPQEGALQTDSYTVAIDQEYTPYEFLDSAGRVSGFIPDLLEEISKDTGVKFLFKPMAWPDAADGLETGRVDLVSMIQTPSRNRTYHFSNPHSKVAQALFTHSSAVDIVDLESLAGHSVAFQHNDISLEMLKHRNDFEKRLVNSKESGFLRLNSGKVDAFFAAEQVGVYFIKNHGLVNIRPILLGLFPQDFCFASLKGGNTELINFLNIQLQNLKDSGRYDDIFEKWFPPIFHHNTVPLANLIKSVIIVLIPILLFFAVVGIWYLRREVRNKTKHLSKEIEERKLVAEQFLHSQNLMHYVISHARSAIAVHDRDLKYVYVSERYLTEYKVQEKNIIGKHHYEIFPDLPQKWRDVHQRALSGEISSAEEDPYVREDGSVAWTRWECRPWYESDGIIGGIVIYTEVITSQVEAKISLRKSQEEWEKTFNAISDIITIQDKEMRIVRANKAAYKAFQIEPGGLTGKYCYEFFRNGKKPCLTCPIPSTIEEETTHSIDITHDKLGKIFNVTTSPILDKNGNFSHIVHIAKDITEKKKTEKELLKVRKMESVGTLAGGIAHDFNNILAAILGNINLALLDTDLKSETRKLLSKSEQASLRAKDLTQQLLTFAKGGEPIKKVSSLEDIIVDSANFILRGDNVSCQFDIAHGLWLVDVDKGQISQVVQNIVLNATQAMPEGGTIKITCENISSPEGYAPFIASKNEKYVKICIQDSGIGIPANIVEKIFDPYFSTKQKGSGLGLATSHSIISKHGGYIGVDSSPGAGTTFSIYIPASEATKEQTTESLEGAEIPSRHAKILLMDDEEIVRDVVKSMMTHLGHNLELSKEGEEAINFYQKALQEKNTFDLVIMDLTIPGGMGGKDAVQEILKLDPGAKVIVASGYSTDPIMANHKEYGFCAAIVKPFQLQDLSRVITQALD